MLKPGTNDEALSDMTAHGKVVTIEFKALDASVP